MSSTSCSWGGGVKAIALLPVLTERGYIIEVSFDHLVRLVDTQWIRKHGHGIPLPRIQVSQY